MVNILILPAAHVVKTEQDAEASATQACEILVLLGFVENVPETYIL